jgi:hypothetical protein
LKPYTDLKGLQDIVLEESYILAITATPGQVVFKVDFVLTPDHPHYQPYNPVEAFACFRRGELRFQDIKILYWTGQSAPPSVDATGELDYGHIETFEWEPACYQLLGDWGYMEVTGGDVQVTIDDAEGQAR